MSWLKSILFFALVLFSTNVFSQPLKAGGEIPWPLSSQHVVTVNHGEGLWELGNSNCSKYFNVEIVAKENGYDWIRVAELDKKTFEVLSWGEGFFSNSIQQESSSGYSNIFVNTKTDIPGRYMYMFPKGDINDDPYVIRLVEVETPLGYMLGLSIIDIPAQKYEHFLGQRVLKKPLACTEEDTEEDNLICQL